MPTRRMVRLKGLLVLIAVLMLLFGGACDNSGDTGPADQNCGVEVVSGVIGIGLLILVDRLNRTH